VHFETHAFQNTREKKNLDNGADVRKVVDFQRKGVDFRVKTVMFVTIVGKKKNKGERGHFRTRRLLARLSPSPRAPTRTRSSAIFDFCLHSFTPPFQATH